MPRDGGNRAGFFIAPGIEWTDNRALSVALGLWAILNAWPNGSSDRETIRGMVRPCLHGLKGELRPYRSVRLWEMNCGEVKTSLSPDDFFGNLVIAHEWVAAALDGQTDGWMSLDLDALERARRNA